MATDQPVMAVRIVDSSNNVLETLGGASAPLTLTETVGASALTLTGATQVASFPVLTMTQTWNNGAVTFTGVKLNVTDTASAAGYLLDLQVGGATKMNVAKNGDITLTSAGSIFLGNSQLHQNFLAVATGGNGIFNRSENYYFGASDDVVLTRDAAAIMAQRNGTNAQTFNIYDTYASSTDYHRLAIKTARATLSAVSGASVTATSIIPDGAVVVGVTSKVTTGLGTGNSTTGYTIGDGSDADRWGAIVGTASGTSSDNTNWTATTIQAFTTASDIVVTATGGNFDGTGVIYLSVQYLIGQCD